MAQLFTNQEFITDPITGAITFVTAANALKVDGSGVTQSVSGTVSSTQGTPAALAGAWPVEITDGTNILGTAAHPVQTTAATSSSSTVTQTTATGVNQTLLAANVNRKEAILFFTSGTWQVKYGAGASTTSFTVVISSPNTMYVVTLWTGQIDVVGQSGKLVNVTELS